MNTKRTISIIVLVISSLSIHAQDMDKKMREHLKEVEKSKEKGSLIWDMDTVYNAGIPIFIMTEKTNGFLQPSDYSVKSLSGQEVIYVKADFYVTNPGRAPGEAENRTYYYTFLFMDTKNKAEIGYPAKIYKQVADNGLISNGNLSSDAESKFIALNGTKYSTAAAAYQQPQQVVVVQNNVNGAATTGMIDRNRTGTIQIMNGYIMQSSITIGTATQNQVAQNGDITKTIDIFYTNGVKVAEATCVGINTHSWNVVTTKDNQVRIINSTFNNDAMDIIKFLIANYYL